MSYQLTTAKVWNGVEWIAAVGGGPGGPGPTATGGTVTTSGDYTYHTFLANGTFTVTESGFVDVLIIAGGGSQGSTSRGGTGGGAGGLVLGYYASIDPGSYPVVVGAGGSYLSNGSDSSIFGAVADGGGSGGSNGGSGGGGGPNTATPYGVSTQTDQVIGDITAKGYGNRGGDTDQGGTYGQTQGGGGGAGSLSLLGLPRRSVSTGGSGIFLGEWADATNTGHYRVYASGGSGGGESDTLSGAAIGGGGVGGVRNATGGSSGIVNTGGGGGGHAYVDQGAQFAGGSGIVIVRYLT